MTHKLIMLLLALCCARMALPMPAGFATLAPNTLVVVGKGAPAMERQAAEMVAASLRAAGGPADNLVEDETLFRQLHRSAFNHLILVGTYSSNELLRQQWGHFALDRAAFLKEPALPTDAPRPPFYTGMPTQGFYVFGYNTFTNPATGYLECGRNDLSLVPAALDTPQQPGYRLRCNLTGVNSAGVMRAAQAFLHSGLLNGVLPAAKETLPAQGDAFVLAGSRYSAVLPFWVPAARLLGWTQPDASEYAGFLQASGQSALCLWRAKYLTDRGVVDFDSAPSRRATANELFIAQLATPAMAQQALTKLAAALSGKPLELKVSPTLLDGHAILHVGTCYLAASGPWVLMESLPEAQGQQVLAAALQQLGQGDGR